MNKMNEIAEASEQETPFHQLSQEEQHRISSDNQKRVREAPTIHEWEIRVRESFVPVFILLLIGTPVIIGAVMLWNKSSNGWVFIIVGAIMFPYLRYLVMADKHYHYRLTTEGLITTYHDAIPEVAYTIVRGLAWLGVVVCVIAVAVLGPLALVGAGGMALFAIFFTNFEKKISVEYTVFNKDQEYVVKVVKNRGLIRFDIIPFSWFEFSYLYCNEGELYKVLSGLMRELGCYEYREFKSELSLRRAPVGVLDVGVPRKLDEIEK
ncbi:hypothetical protein [Aeromonas salmonicida]|uniref:hypothetical protein n=1 Tax=Aeromonas salmonicida TaxID=645 RepID=UPI00223F0364|nr:hypothetical protein [Aeromonas salmonicida]MDM5066322.1 hypothetical protein [Aeromonas salmonicida]MDR6996658.1 hypothetical protein [Aeromonas salmonicida]